MTMRTAFIGAVVLLISATSAHSQGQPKKDVVLSRGVLKSMTANKPKTKTPLGAKVGIGRKSNVVVTTSVQVAPTSVTAIGPVPAKR